MTTPKDKLDDLGREKVQCEVCKRWYHRLDVHIKSHKLTVKTYKKAYGADAPTISETASEKAREAAKAARQARSPVPATPSMALPKDIKAPFKIGVARLYQRTDINDDDKEFVPEHDADWLPGGRGMEEWELLALAIESSSPAYLHGPTGCGKSTSVMELASALSQPLIRVQMSQQFKESAMIGKTDLIVDPETGAQVTRWTDGILPMAMRRGWWLLVDEFTATPPGIMFVLQAVLEGNPLVLPTGEVVRAHKHFNFIATDNTNGRGDETGLYAGTHVMNESTLDRFGVVIACDYPAMEDEIKITMNKGGVDEKTAKAMVSVARKIRDSFTNEACFCTFSTRKLITWAKLSKKLGDIRKAAHPAVLNKLGRDDAKFVGNIIQRFFGGAV